MKKNVWSDIIALGIIFVLAVAAVYFLHNYSMLDIFTWYRNHLNYATITLLMAIESSFIPFPSEIVVPPAAYFAATNASLSVPLVIGFSTLGAIIGAVVNYVIALAFGRPIVYAFAQSKLGSLCLLNEQKVAKAEDYFARHGAVSTFFGRLVPAVRQLISIPAGLARMSFLKFIEFTILGAGLWNCVLAALGYWLSTFVPEKELFEQVEHYNQYLTYAGYALGAAIIVFLLWQVFKTKNKTAQ